MAAGRLLPCAAGELPRVSRGEGVHLYDDEGRRYLDGSSGAVAANLGHGNARIAEALADQARTVAFAHRTQWRSRPAERLAELVGEITPADLDQTLFTSSGSEANEAAMRIALAYWHASGREGKTRFVTRHTSYHGSTLGALSLTGQARRRAGVEPLLHPFPRLHGGRAAPLPGPAELEAELRELDPASIAAVVTEPVGGASGGALVPPPGYHERLRAWCDANDVLWIADEVMCGFGRTGRWFAVEHWDALPDAIVFGKGVSGGYAPLAGVAVAEGVATRILEASGFISFGHTYSNVPITCAVGVAVIEEMHERELVENARAMGARLGEGLQALADRHGIVGEARGMGLLRALELADPGTGRPLPREAGITARLLAEAREAGLVLYPAGQGMHGGQGDAVLIAPPLVIGAAEVDELVEKLDGALARVGSQLRASRPGGEYACLTAP